MTQRRKPSTPCSPGKPTLTYHSDTEQRFIHREQRGEGKREDPGLVFWMERFRSTTRLSYWDNGSGPPCCARPAPLPPRPQPLSRNTRHILLTSQKFTSCSSALLLHTNPSPTTFLSIRDTCRQTLPLLGRRQPARFPTHTSRIHLSLCPYRADSDENWNRLSLFEWTGNGGDMFSFKTVKTRQWTLTNEILTCCLCIKAFFYTIKCSFHLFRDRIKSFMHLIKQASFLSWRHTSCLHVGAETLQTRVKNQRHPAR